jgi:hypothetical protein
MECENRAEEGFDKFFNAMKAEYHKESYRMKRIHHYVSGYSP